MREREEEGRELIGQFFCCFFLEIGMCKEVCKSTGSDCTLR